MIGYKWIKNDMTSANGNETPWEIGVWKEWNGNLELCQSGFHASVSPLDSLNYIYGDRWFVVQAEGKISSGNDKFVSSRMRVVRELPAKEIMTKFAIACAKQCLFRFEARFPDDARPRKAIEAAEQFFISARAAYAAAAAARAAYAAGADAGADAAAAAAAAARAAYAGADAGADAAAWTAERSWQNRKLERIILAIGGSE